MHHLGRGRKCVIGHFTCAFFEFELEGTFDTSVLMMAENLSHMMM